MHSAPRFQPSSAMRQAAAFSPWGRGWRTSRSATASCRRFPVRMVISANGLFALPPGADPQQLAMLAINPPTAALLLSEYVTLNPGEWVVQHAANSGVGRWVIAFAKTRGLKTVNIVRRPELV